MEVQESNEIAELKQKLKRREVWFERLQADYAELNAETENLREEVERLKKERDEALGDNTKLKAEIDTLSAKLNLPGNIILP